MIKFWSILPFIEIEVRYTMMNRLCYLMTLQPMLSKYPLKKKTPAVTVLAAITNMSARARAAINTYVDICKKPNKLEPSLYWPR